MIYVLVNPKSNNGKGEKEIREWASKVEGDVTYINVLETENMKSFLSTLKEEDEIIVSGGDGTLHHFINDIYDLKLKNKMYYVKTGSGNDFYRDNKEYEYEKGRILLNPFLDKLPTVKVNGLERKFINNVGYGLDGETARIGEEKRVTSDKPIHYKRIAFSLLFGKYKLNKASIIIDGETYKYDNVWLAATMKGRFYGGGVMAAPSQNRFDKEGRVSLVCLHKKCRIITLLLFPIFTKGKHEGKKWASVFTGKNIEVKFESPCSLQIDGEVVENVTSYIIEVN